MTPTSVAQEAFETILAAAEHETSEPLAQLSYVTAASLTMAATFVRRAHLREANALVVIANDHLTIVGHRLASEDPSLRKMLDNAKANPPENGAGTP